MSFLNIFRPFARDAKHSSNEGSSKFVGVNGAKRNDGSLLTKQVPLHVLVCHGSDPNKGNYHDSAPSCDSMADNVNNHSLDGKHRLKVSEKSEIPMAPVVDPELPNVELSYFDGQPRRYWKFVRQFQTYVALTVMDDSQRLLCLIHYCKSRAKATIEGCIMMNTFADYKRVRGIPKRLFGQSHVIVRETLEDLLNTANFDYNDAEQLVNLDMRMENCALFLEQMNYTANLNSLVILEKIVRLLPTLMQAQGSELVNELTENDIEQKFVELTKLIISRARVASSRFGRLVNRPKKGHNVKTNCHLQSGQWNDSTTKTKCSICSDENAVYRYLRFLAQRERVSALSVLGKVHECKFTKRCNVDRCAKNTTLCCSIIRQPTAQMINLIRTIVVDLLN